jgi:hypothetical protein
VRVFRRQGLRKFRRCTFNQLRFLLKGAIGLPSFRRLINIPFYFRFPEMCFVGLGVLPLARPFSRPQKRGSPSTSCCCSDRQYSSGRGAGDVVEVIDDLQLRVSFEAGQYRSRKHSLYATAVQAQYSEHVAQPSLIPTMLRRMADAWSSDYRQGPPVHSLARCTH